MVNEFTLAATRSCRLFVDNQATLAPLIKRPTLAEIGAGLVGVSGAFAARIPVQRRLGYVHTGSNDADEPSRARNASSGSVCSLRNGLTPKAASQPPQSWKSPH